MGLRHWLQERLGGGDDNDAPTRRRSVIDSLWREEEQEERIRALGDYDSTSFPPELADLLTRRQQVAEQLIGLDIADPAARVAAIPRLQKMLQTYPHPLVYETLIHAYLDAGRDDEAKGVAFAARERRHECARSEYPEIRAEIENLREWGPGDVDRLREERDARASTKPG